MATTKIPNIWDATNQSVRWAFDKDYKPTFNKNPQLSLDKSKVTWVIGIRLADMLPVIIEIAALAPDGYDCRAVGPCHGGRVLQQDLHRITILCSPKAAPNLQGRQVQRHNYNTFISIMASMFEKYGADILK